MESHDKNDVCQLVAKQCSNCLETLPTSSFYREKRSTTGLTSRCKPCSRQIVSDWQKDNRERKNARTRIWWLDTAEQRHAYQREWAANNSEKLAIYKKSWAEANPDKVMNAKLIWNYGITLDEYKELLSSQGGKCAICQSAPLSKNLCVDHNHDTGKVRGLLCDMCNKGLGHFKDNLELLSKAVKYITKYDRQ